MSRTVQIEYLPNDELDRKYPDVSKEVIVPADWTLNQIIEWYEKRHSHIHHVGVKVLKVGGMN